MKKLLLLLSLILLLGSCNDSDPNQYSETMEVDGFQANTLAYKGTIEFRELVDGNLELAELAVCGKSF